jgi:hypothetical protein
MGALVASTSARTEARRQARTRLAAKVAARRRREQAELEHITDLEAALARRAQAEIEMAAAVAGLLEFGNSIADTATLTEQPETEIRRLHKLATRAASTPAENDADEIRHRPAEPPRDGERPIAPAFGSDAASAAATGGGEVSPGHADPAAAVAAAAEPDVAL